MKIKIKIVTMFSSTAIIDDDYDEIYFVELPAHGSS